MTSTLKKNLIFVGKIVIWLISSFFFGYVIGSIIALEIGTQPMLFIYGFYFALSYATFVASPVFLICTAIYFLFNKKRNFDKKIRSTVLLTMLISTICTIIITFLLLKGSQAPFIFYAIFFFPSWLGPLIPRLILPFLKPGRV